MPRIDQIWSNLFHKETPLDAQINNKSGKNASTYKNKVSLEKGYNLAVPKHPQNNLQNDSNMDAKMLPK